MFNLNQKIVAAALSALSLTLMISSYAQAQVSGTDLGNGGDTRCLEYNQLAGTVVLELAKIGQAEIDKEVPIVRVDDLLKIKQQLKCVPIPELDRQARSNPSTTTTTLLVEEWEKLNFYARLTLVAHELSVLAEYENDGESHISEQLTRELTEKSALILRKISAKEIIVNPDNSKTYYLPNLVVNGQSFGVGAELNRVTDYWAISIWDTDHRRIRKSAQGFCKRMGLNRLLSVAYAEANRQVVILDDDGRLIYAKRDRADIMFATAITCTN